MEPVASSRCPSQRDQARASARAFLFRVPEKTCVRRFFLSGARPQVKRKPAFAGFLSGTQAHLVFDNCFILL